MTAVQQLYEKSLCCTGQLSGSVTDSSHLNQLHAAPYPSTIKNCFFSRTFQALKTENIQNFQRPVETQWKEWYPFTFPAITCTYFQTVSWWADQDSSQWQV